MKNDRFFKTDTGKVMLYLKRKHTIFQDKTIMQMLIEGLIQNAVKPPIPFPNLIEASEI